MRTLTLAAALAVSATALAADPVAGVWATEPDDNGNVGHIQVAPCGDDICGVLVRAYDNTGTQAETDQIGMRIVWGMKNTGPGTYGGGKVYAPDRDRTYNSKMTLSGNSLKVEGCVLGICRGTSWTRVQ